MRALIIVLAFSAGCSSAQLSNEQVGQVQAIVHDSLVHERAAQEDAETAKYLEQRAFEINCVAFAQKSGCTCPSGE